MIKQCNKCHSTELEELVWADVDSGEITDRLEEYHCRSCGCKVDIIITNDDEIKDTQQINYENNNSNNADSFIDGVSSNGNIDWVKYSNYINEAQLRNIETGFFNRFRSKRKSGASSNSAIVRPAPF